MAYIGRCNSDGTLITGDPTGEMYNYDGHWIYCTGITYQCPGASGSYNINALQAYGNSQYGAASVRIAIYATDLTTLYAQSGALTAFPDTTPAWTPSSDTAIQYATLTAGLYYSLVAWIDSNNGHIKTYAGSSGWTWTTAEDLTTGFHANLTGGAYTYGHDEPLIRAQVTAAGGGATAIIDGRSTISQPMNHYFPSIVSV